MFAPGDAEIRRAPGRSADQTWPPSPRLVALATALSRLLAAANGVTDALTRHDRTALEASNELAGSIVADLGDLVDSLTDEDRADIAGTPIPRLREQLAAAARRNAFLIDQAWAVDAALMRLILGGGKVGPDATAPAYSSVPGPAYVDRGA